MLVLAALFLLQLDRNSLTQSHVHFQTNKDLEWIKTLTFCQSLDLPVENLTSTALIRE